MKITTANTQTLVPVTRAQVFSVTGSRSFKYVRGGMTTVELYRDDVGQRFVCYKNQWFQVVAVEEVVGFEADIEIEAA